MKKKGTNPIYRCNDYIFHSIEEIEQEEENAIMRPFRSIGKLKR